MRTARDFDSRHAARSAWCGLAFLLFAGLAGAALGQARLWPMAHIADQPGDIAELKDSRGRVVASVSRGLPTTSLRSYGLSRTGAKSMRRPPDPRSSLRSHNP